ncbi:MAG: thiamine biosynthesis protein ThiS [Acidobacteria bacterium]|nr:MAG: thiamine biosynthesis protein ThiS [Acidobacteriota bacterium]
MQVSVNGEPLRVPAGSTVADVLRQLALDRARVAVEHNLRVVPKAEHDSLRLNHGDRRRGGPTPPVDCEGGRLALHRDDDARAGGSGPAGPGPPVAVRPAAGAQGPSARVRGRRRLAVRGPLTALAAARATIGT